MTIPRVVHDDLVQAVVEARRRDANLRRLKTVDLFPVDPYIQAAMSNKVVAGNPQCREALKTIQQACQLMFKALRNEGFGPQAQFFGMQRHAICALLKAKWVARYGRATMSLIAAEFEAELSRYGFAEEPEFWTDGDRKAALRPPTGLYKRTVLLQSRRQYGKSLVMQYLAAVYLTVFDYERVLMTSNRANLNDTNRSVVVGLLRLFGNTLTVVNTATVELASGNVLWVRTQGSVRGARPTTIMVDEASFCRPQLFTEGVGPIMINPNRCMHAFTTPNGNNAGWCGLMREDGDFRIVQVRDVCEACESAGRMVCLCYVHHAPDVFLSDEVQRHLRAYYRMDPQAYAEEVLGITVARDVGALPHSWIDRLFASPRWPFEHRVTPMHRRLYLSYDPTSHNVSGTAFLVATQDRDTRRLVLLHIDYERFTTESINGGVRALVGTMIEQLARRYPQHTLITALEANNNASHTAEVAGMLDGACSKYGLTVIHTMHDKGTTVASRTPGLWVDVNTKMAGYMRLRESLEYGELLLAPDMHTGAHVINRTRASTEALLADRLESLRLQLCALKLTQGTRCIMVSGKQDGANDDLAITLINLFYIMKLHGPNIVADTTLPQRFKDAVKRRDITMLPMPEPELQRNSEAGQPAAKRAKRKHKHKRVIVDGD